MKTTCSNCSKTACANQTAKDKKTVLFCSGHKPLNMHNTTKRVDNTSGVKGVWFSKRDNKWVAEFQFRGKKIHVGTFIDIGEAERMIQQKRQSVVKEFTNHG